MNPIFHNGVPITSMEQLQAMYGQPQNQYVPPQPVQQYITIDQVKALIAEQLKPVAAQPQSNPMMAQFEALIQRALTPDDYKQFLAYTSQGAKGFDQMLSGEAFYPIVQLFWDTIKEQSK